jgi:enoyl-CoA hydratase
MKDFETFLVDIQDGIAFVNFNRPNKANAVNAQGWKEMKEVFETLEDHSEARVIVLQGNGKNFCSGIDLGLLMNMQQFRQIEGEARQRLAFRKFLTEMQSSITSIENCHKPVIAAIHGACIGAGVDIVSACDIRYCTDEAYFSIKEVDMGLVADLGTLQRLPKIINPGIVNELAFTGRNVSGQEAKEIGLVNNSLPGLEDMQKQVNSLASNIATKSPLVVKGIKNNLLYTRDHSVSDALNYIAAWNTGLIFSDDLLEAFAASMEKRDGRFKNL